MNDEKFCDKSTGHNEHIVGLEVGTYLDGFRVLESLYQ